MTGRRRALGTLALGALAYACLLFAWFSLPALLSPITEDLGLAGWQAGLLAGAVPLIYVPLSLFSGLAVDRVGPRASIGAGLVLVGVAHLARGVAPGFPSVLLLTFLLGVGGTGITFGLPKLVSVLFSEAETGRASAGYLMGSYLGSAAAFSLAAPVLAPALGGWRPAFQAAGVGVLAFAGLWLVVTRWTLADANSPTGSDEGTSVREDLGAVLSNPALRLLVVVGTAYLLLLHGLQGWLVRLLESRGVATTVAGAATTLFVGAQVVGALGIPALADRFDARRGAVAVCGGLAAVGTAALAAVSGVGPAVGAAAVAGVGIGGLSPLVRALPVELEGIGAARTGAAVGLVFAVGEIGGFAGPFLVGTLYDVTESFVPGLAVLSAGGLAAVVAGAALVRRA